MYPQDIRALTSLRFVAATWVLVYHFRDHLGFELGRFGMVAKGYLGVDLFFILSGFILCHVYGKAWGEKRFNYGAFLWARLARIYPVHLLTLAAMIGIWLAAKRLGAPFDPVAFDPSVWPQHLALVHAWGTTPSVQWNFPSWSISAEWAAYLAFPAVVALSFMARRWAWGGIVGALGLFVVMSLGASLLGLRFNEMTAQVGALRIAPAFLMGAALHRLGTVTAWPRRQAWLGVAAAVAWILGSTSLGAPDIVIWPGLALLIFGLAETSKTQAEGTFCARPSVYLGEVSYALYMTHLPVDIVYFHGLERLFPSLTGAAAVGAWFGVFAACVATSVVVYHGVERPARDWLRRHDPFAGRIASPERPAAAA